MDIVERLRHHKSSDVWTERKNRTWYETDDLCMEAADEIERLRKDYALAWENHLLHEQIFVLTEAKIERLREALTWIERHPVEESKQWEVAVKEMKRLARSALQQKESK